MSTLGDLLAEHTILPGNAVDHLHAVVGEWQLLADLSFADYLMWVRRDDGALVCVAQVRPNTAPTVLLADAVGTMNEADEMPLVTDAFKSGTIGRENPAGQQDSLGLNVEAVPVRYKNDVVAVLTHQTALAARKASPLESAYLDCAGDLLLMLSEGTFPNVGDLAMSRSSPRVGDGFIRLDGAGVVVFASPNAISAYHRMGLTAELEGHNLVSGHPAADRRPVRGAGTGQPRPRLVGRRVEHAHGGRRRGSGRAAAHAAVGGARRGRRRGGADSRRHRGQAPRPGVVVQGCDHPRDPPSGEEQPADRRRTAAPAGPAHQQRRGPRGADRIRAAGVVDRAGARRAVDVGGRGGQPRRGGRPDPADHERRRDRRTPRSASTGSATSACWTPTVPPR